MSSNESVGICLLSIFKQVTTENFNEKSRFLRKTALNVVSKSSISIGRVGQQPPHRRLSPSTQKSNAALFAARIATPCRRRSPITARIAPGIVSHGTSAAARTVGCDWSNARCRINGLALDGNWSNDRLRSFLWSLYWRKSRCRKLRIRQMWCR